jgi:hypothetical protein
MPYVTEDNLTDLPGVRSSRLYSAYIARSRVQVQVGPSPARGVPQSLCADQSLQRPCTSGRRSRSECRVPGHLRSDNGPEAMFS